MKRTLLMLLMSVITLGVMAQGHDGRQRGERGHRGGHGHGPGKAMAILELTDAQKEQIKTLRIAHEKDIKSDEQTLKLKMVELGNLMANDDPNDKAIAGLTDEIGALQTNLLKARVNHRVEVRALLDEEQKLKFDKMKMGQRMGRRGGR